MNVKHSEFDNPELVERIMTVLGSDFSYLGLVDLPEGTFVIVATPLEKGDEPNIVMIFELDTTDMDSEITSHAFAIVDDDKIPYIFQQYCKQYGSRSNE